MLTYFQKNNFVILQKRLCFNVDDDVAGAVTYIQDPLLLEKILKIMYITAPTCVLTLLLVVSSDLHQMLFTQVIFTVLFLQHN